MSTGGRSLYVLVVDDSALVREVMRRALGRVEEFSVATAADPLIASRKMSATRPDVILLDLAMPRMDGLSFLRKVMAEDPVPIVVCSALTAGAADLAMRALQEGAVDVVAKPRFGLNGTVDEAMMTIVDSIQAAARVHVKRRAPMREPSAPVSKVRTLAASPAACQNAVVAIGASTGGTEALDAILTALPENAPGVVIVQHMPEGFTAAFARRLDNSCRIAVKEAADGDRIERGRALIAPGNRHLIVRDEGGQRRVRLVDGPPVSRHRPSVDVLFRSVAEAVGRSAVGVLLTGMGRDGAEGLRSMRESGAFTVVQDETTCVVFGMPKEAIVLGAVDAVLPLPQIARTLLERASLGNRTEG